MSDAAVMAEVWRGPIPESRHRGHAVICDAGGNIRAAWGDPERVILPRSSCKMLQALPLLESGAGADLTSEQLALACASHVGAAMHVGRVAQWLESMGMGEADLRCGTQVPENRTERGRLREAFEPPCQLHNNCSGKHAGFVCAACHSGHDPKGYVTFDHPVQAEIRRVMGALTGIRHDRDNAGVDGCSIPTYAVPLRALAHGFARMASGAGLDPARASAARRIVEACMAEPFYVAGTGRTCTRLMEVAPGRIFVKTGAEGVFCAAIPERGLGIAVKCDDGAARAADSIVAGVLARFFDDDVRPALEAIASHTMRNWNGIAVGDVRASGLTGG